MSETNGQVPVPVPTTIVDPELVVPYLVQQYNQEIEALRQRISGLIYNMALHQGYNDQLKNRIAELEAQIAERDKNDLLEQNT